MKWLGRVFERLAGTALREVKEGLERLREELQELKKRVEDALPD